MLSSIKARIVLFYLVILLVTLSAMGALLYFSLHRIVHASIDSSLLSRAKALATLIREDDRETEFQFSDDVMWEYSSPKSTNYFQIRRVDGATIEKSASLGDAELPLHPVARDRPLSRRFFSRDAWCARLISRFRKRGK